MSFYLQFLCTSVLLQRFTSLSLACEHFSFLACNLYVYMHVCLSVSLPLHHVSWQLCVCVHMSLACLHIHLMGWSLCSRLSLGPELVLTSFSQPAACFFLHASIYLELVGISDFFPTVFVCLSLLCSLVMFVYKFIANHSQTPLLCYSWIISFFFLSLSFIFSLSRTSNFSALLVLICH